jgi:hypothetical protein
MAKKRAPKRRAWNKGLEVGKRDGFTPDQVKRIRGLLADRGVRGLRDLALFSVAIDTMLHGQDLLPLAVGDVQRRDGSIRPVIEVARARGMPAVRCALSKVSTKALKNGSLRPAKSAPIIYSMAVALRAVIRWVSGN